MKTTIFLYCLLTCFASIAYSLQAQRVPAGSKIVARQSSAPSKAKIQLLLKRFLNPSDTSINWKNFTLQVSALLPPRDPRYAGLKQRLAALSTVRAPAPILALLTALNKRFNLNVDATLAAFRSNPAKLSRLVTKQQTLPKREFPYDVSVVSFINFADGIGRQAIGLIDALKDFGLRINWVSSGPESKFDDVPPKVLAILQKNHNTQAGAVAVLEDILTQGGRTAYKAVPQKSLIKIAYSMLESTAIPQEWVTILNTEFDAVAVPDQFLLDVYKNSGVKIPVFLVPLGAYLEDFLKLPAKTKPNKPFIFGSAASGSPRKNTILLVEAFAKAFGNNPDVRLRLNMRSSDTDFLEQLLATIHRLGLTNVEINVKPLNHAEYLKFIKNLDVYVNLSTGEGFSVQPRESIAAGIPTIVTDNTAQSTIARSGFVRAVLSLIKEPAKYGGLYGPEPLGYFFNTTVPLAAQALKDVYTNYPLYLKKAQRGRQWVQQYLYSNLKNKYLNLVRPKTVLFGKTNTITDKALTTNSPELYRKYKSLIT